MIRDFQSLMLPVLRHGAAGEVRIGDVVERVSHDLGLSADERAALLPSGQQTIITNRVHWARNYLKHAGLVENTRRGHFRITDEGRTVLADPPERITVGFLHRFGPFRAFSKRSGDASIGRVLQEPAPGAEAIGSNPEEAWRRSHAQLDVDLAAELLARIRAASPAFFEKLVVNLLIAMGYGGSTVSVDRALVGRSGDGGVDGVIDQDALGLDRVYVQAKRYGEGNTVGAGAIRDFFGSLDRFKAAKGLFVTTSTFTRDPVDTAEMLSKRIVMIDGDKLVRLMIRHDVVCRVQETLVLKKMDDDFFED